MTTASTEKARAGLHALKAKLLAAATLAARAAASSARESAKSTDLFKDQSGETRASIYWGELIELDPHTFVRAGGASKFLENGTKPAKSMRTVCFPNGSFARFVHPGITARPFMHQALVVGQQQLSAALIYYTDEAIQSSNA